MEQTSVNEHISIRSCVYFEQGELISSGSNVLWIGSVFWFSRRQPPPSWIFFQKFDILTFARDCGVDRRHRAIFNQNRSSGCGGDTAISRCFFQHGGRPPSWICWMWLIVCMCVCVDASCFCELVSARVRVFIDGDPCRPREWTRLRA